MKSSHNTSSPPSGAQPTVIEEHYYNERYATPCDTAKVQAVGASIDALTTILTKCEIDVDSDQHGKIVYKHFHTYQTKSTIKVNDIHEQQHLITELESRLSKLFTRIPNLRTYSENKYRDFSHELNQITEQLNQIYQNAHNERNKEKIKLVIIRLLNYIAENYVLNSIFLDDFIAVTTKLRQTNIQEVTDLEKKLTAHQMQLKEAKKLADQREEKLAKERAEEIKRRAAEEAKKEQQRERKREKEKSDDAKPSTSQGATGYTPHDMPYIPPLNHTCTWRSITSEEWSCERLSTYDLARLRTELTRFYQLIKNELKTIQSKEENNASSLIKLMTLRFESRKNEIESHNKNLNPDDVHAVNKLLKNLNQLKIKKHSNIRFL